MIRRLRAVFLTVVAIVSVVSLVSQARAESLMTRHTRDAVLSGEAKSVGRLPATQSMHLGIGLALRHQPELENFLQELYSPSSPSYHQFLTVEEFTARFGPSQSDYDAVIRFAQENGFTVTSGSRNRMLVQVTGTVGNVEKAFHVQMGLYQHPTENRTFYAPDREPTVNLSFELWNISGLDNFSIPRPNLVRQDAAAAKARSNATTGSGPDDSFLGSDMRAAYYGASALTGTGQSLGLLEYAGTDLAALNTYYKNVGQTESVPVTLTSVDGTPTSCLASQGCDDTEQTIDMTQALGMAPGMSSLVMYIGSTDSLIFNAMATAKPLNAQLSCSWYWSPADPQTLNPIFEEFAAQGQNLFDAAGDHSKWPPSIWPADNAYLVSVGGTDLETTKAAGPWASETAWSDGGGGISPNSIPIPSWQVATADQCTNPCSKTLRNGPDVSANSNFTFYVCADQTTCSANSYGGTSFAAPMWAGYLALVNQQSVANGNKTLGFINPAIYTIGLGADYDTDFHDITSGSNGYSATKGYDLATGWGSPNGSALITALAGSGSGGPGISFAPATLKWGKVAVGTTTAGKKVVVTNSGTATLTITSIGVSGDFALVTVKATKKVTPCVNGSSVAPGATCEIKVSFSPLTDGALSGAVSFTDNAAGSPQQVTLTGTGKD